MEEIDYINTIIIDIVNLVKNNKELIKIKDNIEKDITSCLFFRKKNIERCVSELNLIYNFCYNKSYNDRIDMEYDNRINKTIKKENKV